MKIFGKELKEWFKPSNTVNDVPPIDAEPESSQDNTDKPSPSKKPPHNKLAILITVFVVLLGIDVSLAYRMYNDSLPQQPTLVPYSTFKQDVADGNVDIIYYNSHNPLIKYCTFNEITQEMTFEERAEYEYAPEEIKQFTNPDYESFARDMLDLGIRIEYVPESSAEDAQRIELLFNIISLCVSALFCVLMFNAFMNMSNMNSKKLEKDLIQTSDVTFDDIIGHEEVLDDIKFITKLIKDKSLGDEIGAKTPRGLLLVGPPGTGKTMLAKAIAHEAGVPFLYQNASGLVELYVGMGAKRVRALFKIARKNAPCIIFIDEIDAVGVKRGHNNSHSEIHQTVNAILQEMDGFESRDGIFVIAATNRVEDLDEALVRAGRFDRQITVNPPRDWTVRKKLFQHYFKSLKVDESVNIDNLSKQVAGFTGADIAAICNEASIIAVMKEKKAIDTECIEEAIDKKVFKGNRSKHQTQQHDREIVAYHEAGHAIMSYLLGEPIARASIQATISGVGGAVFNEETTSSLHPKSYIEHRIMIAYAGRASEEIKFQDVTTGATNDITQATGLLNHYVKKYGFDKDFGLLDADVLAQELPINNEAMVKKLSSLSKEFYTNTVSTLRPHYQLVEILAQALLDKETLSGDEINELLKDMPQVTIQSGIEKLHHN